jgi:hypothetical protein
MSWAYLADLSNAQDLLRVRYSPEPTERPLVEGFVAPTYPVW